VLCSSCRYCVPACPMDLDIPLLIKGYNVLNTSGSTWRAEGFDKAKSPDHCIGCGACAALCPQNIDIPNVMQKLTKALAK
ncbi:MAG: 4Fe-4S dicluster domain-containing protein, partial [Clostridia bacterium]|nr:4Fe-4S dicluster domain-containing protein [Clostridia bacterium]